jgi:hypothetical protein
MNWFVLRVASNKESQRPRDAAPQGPDREHDPPGRPHPGADREDQDHQERQAEDHRDQALPRLRLRRDALEPDGRIPQDVFFLIKETTGVGDFVGTAGRPTPMKEHEIEKMLLDSASPRTSPTSSWSSPRASTWSSRKARSRATRARSTKSAPRRARSACWSRSSAARRRSSSKSGRSARPRPAAGAARPAPSVYCIERGLEEDPGMNGQRSLCLRRPWCTRLYVLRADEPRHPWTQTSRARRRPQSRRDQSGPRRRWRAEPLATRGRSLSSRRWWWRAGEPSTTIAGSSQCLQCDARRGEFGLGLGKLVLGLLNHMGRGP